MWKDNIGGLERRLAGDIMIRLKVLFFGMLCSACVVTRQPFRIGWIR